MTESLEAGADIEIRWVEDDPSRTRAEGFQIEPQAWGELAWMVSGALGSSASLTVGRCRIEPGEANPRHRHPNCDEVLYVMKGRIEHTVDERRFSMSEGDIVSIPRNSLHNAINVGDDVAELLIVFDTAHRETVGE